MTSPASPPGETCEGQALTYIFLFGRVDKPLDFLGLYKTHNDASSRTHIPAICVSGMSINIIFPDNTECNNTGDSDEAQILVAGQRYLDRPAVLETILNDLFHVFRYETCQNTEAALDILLLAMEG